MGSRARKSVPFFVDIKVACSSPAKRALMDDYVRGSLNPTQRQTARKHLEECPSCAAFVFNTKEVTEAQAKGGRRSSSQLRRVR